MQASQLSLLAASKNLPTVAVAAEPRLLADCPAGY
jgi:hypothetical protein